MHESAPGTSLTSRDVRLDSAKWAKRTFMIQVAVTNRDAEFCAKLSPEARSPRDFWGKNISGVLIIFKEKGRAWTACAPAPTP